MDQWAATYDRLTQLIQENRTTLIFVNTRSHCERLAHHLPWLFPVLLGLMALVAFWDVLTFERLYLFKDIGSDTLLKAWVKGTAPLWSTAGTGPPATGVSRQPRVVSSFGARCWRMLKTCST